MIYFFKPLPEKELESEKWIPFREKEWLRKYFMVLVYILQGVLLVISMKLGIWNLFDVRVTLALLVCVFIVHEMLHIAVVYRAGDISLTYHGGIFLWLTPDAVLSKRRYWLYMTLPLIALTVIPSIFTFFCKGKVYDSLMVISWQNVIIAGADILDSPMILLKPRKSIFWRGRYRVPDKL